MSEMNTNATTSVGKILLLYLLGVLGAMTISEAVPALEGIAKELHPSSPAMIGLVMSLPGLVVAIGALASGFLVDRYGDKIILAIGGVITAIGDVTVIAAPNMQALLGGRLIAGIGYVLVSVSALTMLIRVTSGTRRTWALALWSTFVPASFIIPLVTAGIVQRINWRVEFIGHAILFVACLIGGLLLFPAPPKQTGAAAHASHTAGLAQVVRSPWVYLLGISFGADSFLHNGVISTLGPFLHHSYAANVVSVDGWNVGSMFTNALGCLLLGKLLTSNYSPRGILLAAVGITAIPGIILYSSSIGTVSSLACSWTLMFGSGILTGMWTYVPTVAPSPQCIGSTSGLITQLTMLGVLISGPTWFSSLASTNRYAMLFTFLGAIFFICFRTPIVLRNRGPHTVLAQGMAAPKMQQEAAASH